ncbi:uncharacterized aarF domain-containing protein kinase 2-like isoform X2 [Bacillus rossius redtenbacheri]|uniref:uncharacterized aarF domain-containing protein kinase 2-like isoform X2 n=2 Tax=Bacillus rossius redtenbacheri TaxID=93214 RepID=UPI002FDDCF14
MCRLIPGNFGTRHCYLVSYRPINERTDVLSIKWFNLSGPIFLKLGQWASTRRDLFPDELCSHLSRLQRCTRPHSALHTVRLFRRAYGPHWDNIFVKFSNDGDPIGSGCCAQVYKAWINPETVDSLTADQHVHQESKVLGFLSDVLEAVGLAGFLDSYFKPANMLSSSSSCEGDDGLIPVAVKVLHPAIERTLRQDLSIMKGVARMVTWMFPSLHWLSLSDCVDDFAQTMKAQVDFHVEAGNLERFTHNFESNDAVVFPRPLWALTRPYLLVETFEEGRPMQDYVSGRRRDPRLAELGINTIFKMERARSGAVQKRGWLSGLRVRPRLPQAPERRLVVLDCGIVTRLDARGEKALKAVFSAVANNDGDRVAELFLEHSNHQCDDPAGFKQEMRELVTAALSKNVTLQSVQVAGLLSSLFQTITKHKVKLDGSFSSIILAMMVLEGLGRSLDPTIDVVDKAKPFLLSAM